MDNDIYKLLCSRPIYKNSLVFPVWVFDGMWHIYHTTDFYMPRFRRRHHCKCGKMIEKNYPKFSRLGWKFMNMPDVCPKCRELELHLLKERAYIDEKGNRR
jgi:hypothetical protein